MKRLLALALVAASISACGGSSTSAPTYKTSAELLAALKAAGMTCTGYEKTPKDEREWGTEGALEAGSCELDGESVDITIWKDAGQRRKWEALGKTLGCSMGEAFGVTEFDYLNGDTWTISETSQTLANDIESKFAGKAVHIDC